MDVIDFLDKFLMDTRGRRYEELLDVTDIIAAELFDSFMWMHLLMRVDENYGCELDLDELICQKTLPDLAEFISDSINNDN